MNIKPSISIKHSTARESILETSMEEIGNEISVVTGAGELLHGEMESYMERTVNDLTTNDELQHMASNLNATINQQRNLVLKIHQQQKEIEAFKSGVGNEFEKKLDEIEVCKQAVFDSEQQLEEVKKERNVLEGENENIKREHSDTIFDLNQKIEQLTQECQLLAAKKAGQVDISVLDNAQEMVQDLETELEEKTKAEKSLKAKLLRCKRDQHQTLQLKQEENDKLFRSISHLELQVAQDKQKLQKTNDENAKLLVKQERIEKHNNQLVSELSNLQHQTRSLSAENKSLEKLDTDLKQGGTYTATIGTSKTTRYPGLYYEAPN